MRIRALTILLAAIVVTACQSDQDAADEGPDVKGADRVLTGGKIYTVNDSQPWAMAVAVVRRKLVYVGSDEGVQRYIGPDTVVSNLNGRLVIPGLVDSHTHPGRMGRFPKPAPLPTTSRDDIIAAIAEYADANPDLPWIVMCCFPLNLYDNGRTGPRKKELDRIVPDRPVWITSDIGHSIWVNSVALQLMGVKRSTVDPHPGVSFHVRDRQGEATGWIKESAVRAYKAEIFKINKRAHQEGMLKYLEYLVRHGVTSVFDAGNSYDSDAVYSYLSDLDKAGRLPLRYEGSYHIFLPGQQRDAVDGLKRLKGKYSGNRLGLNTVKIHFDGSNENRTGAVLEPYRDDPGNRGGTVMDMGELRDFMLQLHDAKFDLHVHTVGDRAVQIVLNAAESATIAMAGQFYPRITVSHLDIIDSVDYPRFKQLGVIANYTPTWHGANYNDPVLVALGKERYSRTLVAQPLFDDDAVVTFSSDVTSLSSIEFANPYLGMQIAHNRQYAQDSVVASWGPPDIRGPMTERLSMEDIIKSYTLNGAYQLRMEHQLGSIEVGKLADIVVLNQNLFEIDRNQIHKVRPDMVMMEGQVVHGRLE